MSNLNSAGGGLRYRGTNAPQPPNCNFHPRDPNDFDRFGYSLLDFWLNTETENLWVLVALEGNSTSGGIRATWVQLSTPVTDSGIISTSGNDGVPVFGDPSGNINIIGTDPLFVTGTPGTNTETITVATATTAQIGVTTLATDALTIAGASTTTVNTPASLKAKLGAQTTNGVPYGQGQTSAIAWTSAGTNGQVLIAATGAPPAFATLTSSDASITFATSPNGLDLTAAIAGGSSILTTVYDTPGTYAFTKNTATKKIEIWGWAGGGGGSSRGASGSAGGTFHYSFPSFFVDDAPTTIEVVVGAGGAGGTPGSPAGLPGGASWFGNFTTGNNTNTGINQSVNNFSTSGTVLTEGGPSFPGDYSSPALGTRIAGTTGTIMGWFSGVEGPFSGTSRNANDGATGGTGTITNFLGAMLGGVGGGGGSTGTAFPAGGNGGGIRNRRTLATIVSGGAGGAVGIAGSAGNDTYPSPAGFNFLSGGTGGGGGGEGANGGAGGFPGGGGGGAGPNAVGTGVATGGAGGDGMIIVMEFLSD